LIVKNRERMRRHLKAATDALDRAEDGLDVPDHCVQEDAYFLQQLAIATEALAMARHRMLDLKTVLAEQEENAFPEG